MKIKGARKFKRKLIEINTKISLNCFQVLEQYGRELCIVVTNLSQMSTEYFHPKTTPNTPIRMAVRMSAALPGNVKINYILKKLYLRSEKLLILLVLYSMGKLSCLEIP